MYAYLSGILIYNVLSFIIIISTNWDNIKPMEEEVDDMSETDLSNNELMDLQIRKKSGVGESEEKKFL